MALPAFVNAVQGNNYSGTNFATLSTTSITLTAGNLVTVLVRGGSCTVADTLGNVYTLRGQGASAAPIWIFSCANCIGGATTITVTFTPAVNFISIVAMQFSGAATSGELIATFSPAPVTVGTTIDATYDTGGVWDAIIVGIADVFASGTFNFTPTTSVAPALGYTEPIADHTSASFFYRILTPWVSASEIVRATCNASGAQKNLLIATFRPASTAVQTVRVTQDVVEVLSLPTPDIRVTQDAVEVLSQVPSSSLRMTQYVIEILSESTPSVVAFETTQFQIMMP